MERTVLDEHTREALPASSSMWLARQEPTYDEAIHSNQAESLRVAQGLLCRAPGETQGTGQLALPAGLGHWLRHWKRVLLTA